MAEVDLCHCASAAQILLLYYGGKGLTTPRNSIPPLTPIVVPVVADPAPQGNTSPDAMRKLPVDRAEKVTIKVRAIAKERPISVSVTNAPHRVCKARKKPGVGIHILPGAWPM